MNYKPVRILDYTHVQVGTISVEKTATHDEITESLYAFCEAKNLNPLHFYWTEEKSARFEKTTRINHLNPIYSPIYGIRDKKDGLMVFESISESYRDQKFEYFNSKDPEALRFTGKMNPKPGTQAQ